MIRLEVFSFRGGEPGMLLQETRFQPLPQQSVVHGDVRQQPGVADAIKASFDVLPESIGDHAVAHQAIELDQRNTSDKRVTATGSSQRPAGPKGPGLADQFDGRSVGEDHSLCEDP